MAQLTKNAYQNYSFKTVDDFKEIQPYMNFFNTQSDQVEKRLYFSQYSTTTAISGGTVADSNDQPILARKYQNNGSILKYGTAGRPASVLDTISKRITISSADDGITFSGLTFGLGNSSYICVVAKVSTAMTMTITLVTSSGNSREFAFDSTNITADSNGFARFISPVTPGTYTNVTVADTGTFDPNSITEVSVIGDTAGTIDLYDMQGGLNEDTFIGSQQTILFQCIDEATFADTLDTADRKCGLITTGKTATDLTVEITLKVRTLNVKSEAAAKGEIVKRGEQMVSLLQNAENGGLTNETIAAGAITISGLDAQKIASVSIDGVILNRVETVGDVNETSFHYNESTGVFTFDTVFNGKTPTIFILVSGTYNYYTRKNLKTGFVGPLRIVRKSATGATAEWEFPAAEIINVEPTQEDSAVSHTFTLSVTPVVEGKDYVYYRRIAS